MPHKSRIGHSLRFEEIERGSYSQMFHFVICSFSFPDVPNIENPFILSSNISSYLWDTSSQFSLTVMRVWNL